MEEKITLCGDNCLMCPRYNAKTDSELERTAELWYRVGWRSSIVSNEEIRCTGCSSHKSCTYGLVECTALHGVAKCRECAEFPCEKINDMLKKSDNYENVCRGKCTAEELEALSGAFFHKQENLMK